MKKQYLIIAAIVLIVAACGQQNGDDKAATTTTAKDNSNNPDYQKGLALAARSNCLNCHKIDDKMLGPSYREVAEKYENNEANVKLLAQKVIKGGQGVWGQVPMTPHPELSEADAEQIIKYIMLLKR